VERLNIDRVVDEPYVAEMNDMMNTTLVSGTGGSGAAGPDRRRQDGDKPKLARCLVYRLHRALRRGRLGQHDDGSRCATSPGTLPARLWHDIMAYAHQGKQPMSLPGTRSPWLEQAASRIWGAPARDPTSRSTAACSASSPADIHYS
jgi:penicillin-binding protein 1A